jgi:hypothetical protein
MGNSLAAKSCTLTRHLGGSEVIVETRVIMELSKDLRRLIFRLTGFSGIGHFGKRQRTLTAMKFHNQSGNVNGSPPVGVKNLPMP